MSSRPGSWDEFIGQDNLKQSLEIAMKAVEERKDVLEHVLLYGPPGLGKTTLAQLLAKTMGVDIKVTSGPAIERAADLAAILSNLKTGDILFIDEVHRLNKTVEETLYPAMEDYCLDLVLGKGPAARTLRLELPKFTLVGATTRIGMLAAPLRDRFGVVGRLCFYSDAELVKILLSAADRLELNLTEESAQEIARRSRRTARVALKILRRIRDYAQVMQEEQINQATTLEGLKLLQVDELGLDDVDRKLLLEMVYKHGGGPVGVETIAALINEEVETIKEVYEPFLMRTGLLSRTPRGRTVTTKAYRHLGLKRRPEADGPLAQKAGSRELKLPEV